MVESEDDDKKEQRQTMERKSTEDTRMMLEDRDKEWSEQRLRSTTVCDARGPGTSSGCYN